MKGVSIPEAPFFYLPNQSVSMSKELVDYLSSFLLDNRLELFKKNLSLRTRYITVVLEDIFQSQNASAVIRSCDCFGIQDLHIIENDNKFSEYERVTRGSSQWVDFHYYNQQQNNTLDAIQKLRQQGYRIVATSPHDSDIDLHHFDLLQGKAAFIFGNEKRGISDVVKQNADCFMKIPMYGFTESLNISVSVAIVAHYLSAQLRLLPVNWQLTDEESTAVMLDWLKKTLKRSDLLLKKFQTQKVS